MGERSAALSRVRRHRRTWITAGGTAAVLATGGGIAWAATGSDGPSYRLAAVTRGDIRQTVTTTGTISSVKSATLKFPVAGVLTSVSVHVGDTVTAGQRVATLDTTQLDQALQTAQAAAAAARQKLAEDLASQSSSSSSDSSASSTPTPTTSSAPSRSNGNSANGNAKLIKEVQSAQQKLLADQHAADLDSDIATAQRAVIAENTACAALLATTSTATPTTPSAPASTPADDSSTDDLQSCQDAIDAVVRAQAVVQDDIHLITADITALDHAVTDLLRALSSSSNTPSPTNSAAATRSSSSTPSSSDGTAKGSSGGTHVPSAADIAADQRSIDAADAQVAIARQNVAQAVLTTPIAGKVADISMVAGQTVLAGSSTSTITVVGTGAKSVSTTVGIADIDRVKVGQTAHVTVDGVTTPITGTVTYIGFLNTDGTSGSSTTYPVTIVLDTTVTLFDGAGAQAVIDVGTAHDVLTVPTSALHGSDRNRTVSVYAGGKVTTRRVTVRAVGIDRAEIGSGLSAGERVVLAEISAPVPSSDQSNRFRGGLGGNGLTRNLGTTRGGG